ncbi:hypothetical protein [Acetivibrio straminisolvens]|uniref:hypothetical protein n=1 Tax=Acetivibrio straminisolvens TaxID=253314 RepID=UPI00103B88C6|nr:hypothetical protein [Acetivibrio straminisolvens]
MVSVRQKKISRIERGCNGITETSKGLIIDIVNKVITRNVNRLLMLDGAKAVRKIFGNREELLRCQLHKEHTFRRLFA